MSEKTPAISDEAAKTDAKSDQPAKTDANSNQSTKTDGMEADYQRHVEAAENAKLEYKEIHRQMAATISTADLEPVFKLFAESENMEVENKDEIVETLRKMFLKDMDGTLDYFWKECEVTNGLVSLAMLKEKFASFEGTNWNMVKKDPSERTLPMRMHLMELTKRYLVKQNEFQEQLLAEKMKEITAKRAIMQEVEKQRVLMRAAIDKQSNLLNEANKMMLKMQREALNTGEDAKVDDNADAKADDKADDKVDNKADDKANDKADANADDNASPSS